MPLRALFIDLATILEHYLLVSGIAKMVVMRGGITSCLGCWSSPCLLLRHLREINTVSYRLNGK